MKSVPGDFWSWFSKFNAEDATGFVAVVLVFSVAAVAVICITIYLGVTDLLICPSILVKSCYFLDVGRTVSC